MGDSNGFHGSEQDELPINLLPGVMEPYQSSVFDLVQLRPTCMRTVIGAAPTLLVACYSCLLRLVDRCVPSCWTNKNGIVVDFLKQAHAGLLDFGRHITLSRLPLFCVCS